MIILLLTSSPRALDTGSLDIVYRAQVLFKKRNLKEALPHYPRLFLDQRYQRLRRAQRAFFNLL